MDALVIDKHVIGHGLTVFMGFFAVMNPLANTPLFLSLTAEDDKATRRTVALQALGA